jgi:hypothetical protein
MSTLIKVKITKKKTINDSYLIKDGDVFEGVIEKFPIVGECIYLYKEYKYSSETILRTTQVQKIENNLFFTRNSIYEIISIVEQRNKLISSILD